MTDAETAEVGARSEPWFHGCIGVGLRRERQRGDRVGHFVILKYSHGDWAERWSASWGNNDLIRNRIPITLGLP